MKKLIISCDDLGASEETNLGIRQCLSEKVATSSSIIANGEFYDHALNHVINQVPIKFYGLHLNLTEGNSLNQTCVNVISDEHSKFMFSAKKYFLLNFNKINQTYKNVIYNELKSQIEKVLKDGIKISHFDSHEHIHHSPWIFKIITSLGKEFNIKKIRFVNEKVILKNYFKNFYYKFKNLNYFKHLLINICNKRINNSFISPDCFFGLLNSGKIDIDEFFLYIDNLNYINTMELCIHPANKFNETNNSEDINYTNFYKSKNRLNEKSLLLSEELKKFLTQKKIDLINFSDI